MRPLELEIHHFGPFINEKILFETLNRKLYLITGSTGSGKTTIFDAMCFALYGEGSNSYRQSKEMKSHFSGCEETMWVRFTFALGVEIYKIERVPEQVRKKERGEGFAKQTHKVSLYKKEDRNFKLLESSVSAVAERVVEIVGLTANQFRQIVMLPQGEFSKLLKAKEDEREILLKSIFKLDIYERFKKEVEDTYKTIQNVNKIHRTTLSTEKNHFDFGDSTPENLEEISTEYFLNLAENNIKAEKKCLLVYKNKLAELNKNLAEEKRALKYYEGIEESYKKMEEEKEKLTSLERDIDKVVDLKKSLELWKSIRMIQPYSNALKEAQNEEKQMLTEGEIIKKKLQEINNQLSALSENYKQVTSQSFEKNLNALSERVNKVRQWKEKKFEADKKQAALIKLKKVTENFVAREKNYAHLEEILSDNQNALKENLAEYNAVILKLAEVSQGNILVENKLKQLKTVIKTAQDLINRQSNIKSIQKNLEIQNWQNQILAEEYAKKKKIYDASLIFMLATKLEKGKPCPVCGSEHHPQKASEETMTVAPEALKSAEDEYNSTKILVETLKGRIDTEQRELSLKNETLEEQLKDFKNLPGKNLQELKNYEKSLYNMLEEYKRATKLLENKRTKLEMEKTGLERKYEEILIDQKDKQAFVESYKKHREENVKLEGQSDQIARDIAVICEALGEKNTNDTAEKIALKLSLMEAKQIAHKREKENIVASYKEKEKQRDILITQKNALDTNLERLVQKISDTQDVLKTLYDSYKINEVILNNTSLPKAEEEKKIQRMVEEHQFNLKSTKVEIEALGKTLDGINPVDITIHRNMVLETEKNIEVLNKKLILKAQKTGRNQALYEILTELNNKIQVAEKKEAFYQRLNLTVRGTLPGSQRVSLERYILSAYLEDILVSANIFLSKMSGNRYRLHTKNGDQLGGLEIEVEDAYTGFSRSANTLSGGETFMAALSMAMGLSDSVQAVSGGIVLDTIFIDEGFATLDPNALDKALNCLGLLNESGRTVGVISHVELLKERIDTKIQVIKTDKGSHIKIEGN